MELNLTLALSMTLMLSLTQCLDSKNSDDNMAYYESQLQRFEQTQDIDAICRAAGVIGNVQRAFPIKTRDRKKLFIQHIKQSLDASHEQGLGEKDRTCSRQLWNDLYVQQTSIITISRDMVTCLDARRVNGIYTSKAYDECAAELNYTP